MRRNRTPFRRFLPMDTDVASMIQIVAIIIALVIEKCICPVDGRLYLLHHAVMQ